MSRQPLLLDRGQARRRSSGGQLGPQVRLAARPARPCAPARRAAAAGPSRRTATCRSVSRAAVTRGLKIGCGALVTAPMLPYRPRRRREPQGLVGKLDPQDSASGSTWTRSGVAVSSRDWFGRGDSGDGAGSGGPGTARWRPDARGARRGSGPRRPGAGLRGAVRSRRPSPSSSRSSCSSRSWRRSGPRCCGSTASGSPPCSAGRGRSPRSGCSSSAACWPPGSVASSLVIGYRTRPIYAPVSPEQQNLDHYRETLEPLRRIATIVVPVAARPASPARPRPASGRPTCSGATGVPFGTKDAAVRPRHRLLRLHPAVAAVRRRLPDHGARARR